MSDSPNNPHSLLNKVISFIQKEREIYGDFSASIPSPSEEVSSSSTENKEKKSQEDKNNTVSDPSSAKTDTSPINKSESPESQEGLFNQDDSNEVYYQIDKCENLRELKSLCETADVLHTDLEGTQLVFGVGNPNADLMIIGEAPGAEEDKQGEPFVGRAGQLLNEILDAINFEREDVYIANILKHRPPNNRNPKPEERKRSLPFLLRQIDLIEPKLILTVGKVAAQTLLDKNQSLTKMRGKFHDFRGRYQLLATYHPAALLRHAKWKRPTWEDVQLLRKRYDELDGTP